MLVNATEMLIKARDGHYGVPQFNINNLEWTKAVLTACEEMKSPVILGVSEGAGKYMTGFKTVAAMVDAMVDSMGITVPVALHQQVHSGLATIIEEAGLDNVFIDFLGANFQLTNEDIDQCLSAVEQAKLVIIHMGPAAMDVATHMIELADRCHTPVLVNPTAYADIPDHLWEKVDYLVLNMSQAAGLCGLKEENSKTARIAASTFGGRVRKAVIVHMDGNGVLIAQDGILRTTKLRDGGVRITMDGYGLAPDCVTDALVLTAPFGLDWSVDNCAKAWVT